MAGPLGGTAKQIAAGASAFGPIGALAGPIIGGLFGRSGQNSANEANLRIARENREWQERMSNTAYQRSAADLSKAGLNRILALGQPASTPAGNIATMQNKNALLAGGITSGVQAGLTAKRLQAEILNINANTQFTDAKKRAIGVAEQVGGTLGDILEWFKGKTGEPTKNLLNLDKGTEATINTIGSKIATSAKEYINKMADSLGISGDKANAILIKTVDEMDLPHMTDAQKIQWAIKNPEKIKQYLDRKRKMQ